MPFIQVEEKLTFFQLQINEMENLSYLVSIFDTWLTLRIMEDNEDLEFCADISFFSIFQARPVVDPLEETDMNEDEEEKETDHFVPGSSYIKLLCLTPAYVLGGMIYSVFEITLQICNHSDCTYMQLSYYGESC